MGKWLNRAILDTSHKMTFYDTDTDGSRTNTTSVVSTTRKYRRDSVMSAIVGNSDIQPTAPLLHLTGPPTIA
jgi:hypothetical protein